ncbi:MAG TPA: glycosyltransferase family 4 protein [Candidatus Baltobacteraceae bacterium]|nr:glycosyltransferase family 4 protein [Candidatus Baltobacteraceae bacterium]
MSLMTGGLQVQAVETWKALSALGGGMTAELFDWSKTDTPCDLYHFISLPPHLNKIAELVREAGRPYVVTLVLGGLRNPFQLRLRAARWRIGSVIRGGNESDRAVAGAASCVTITEADAEVIRVMFRVDRRKISVISNGVPDAFFKCTADAWREAYGDRRFVLCVGAVQQRKNQLLLAQACNRLKLPLVLLGPVLPGQSDYARQVGEAMRENEPVGGRWLQHLRNEDPLLQSAHAACRMFALVSSEETQPLSVMQAMAARKPVLLLKAAYAEDKLFRELPQARSSDLETVADALKQVWESGQATELSPDYTWGSVARQLQTIYNHALNSK